MPSFGPILLRLNCFAVNAIFVELYVNPILQLCKHETPKSRLTCQFSTKEELNLKTKTNMTNDQYHQTIYMFFMFGSNINVVS